MVRADHPDGPWHITDPELAALLTPLRIHHISDVHVGDNAASTVDAKQDPTTDRRMTVALRNTFARDEYVTELDHLARRGLGPHLVVIDQIRVRVERHTHGGKGAGWKPDGAVLAFDVPP